MQQSLFSITGNCRLHEWSWAEAPPGRRALVAFAALNEWAPAKAPVAQVSAYRQLRFTNGNDR